MKRITLSALLMTLFLLIGCNNGGATGEMATTSDGSVIDLKKVSTDIKNAVVFAESVKEIETLVKSVDELAKAIGKKIQANGLAADADKNGSLISGAFQIISTVKTKLEALEQTVGLPNELKAKVTVAKDASKKFLDKLKEENATDDNAKKAIDRNNATKDKGAQELGELNTAIDALLIAADDAVKSAMAGLTTPKAEKTN
ncbi:outer surface protein C (plasmid) [Candidatus Borrelia fainii]|uniref:Outer surface protein C n=1 Tax=Candidatus Borrelia fainii TaxID=2518322 RepID=A0ABM8DLN9_9SPIR|nr:Vsp/OspC family lipoprotein [Candidatus Borrelia fainii]BDU63421.1 outer surface protein C [Candidatus Borrelia fainii]BDU63505.1 outer surface protein C [Candidatus Borrelia fainii]